MGNTVNKDFWFSHFKALHSQNDPSFNERFKKLESLLSEKENDHHVFNQLDFQITAKEIPLQLLN